MNTINNPLILEQEYINRDDGSGDYYYKPNKDRGVNLEVVDLELAKEMLEALEAIQARIKGEFDHPGLLKLGALSTNHDEDILAIVQSAINLAG